MKINKYSLFSCCILWSTLCLNAQTVTTPSPYGTGETKNQTLGSVVGSVPKANASNMVNYNLDLETETYDLYVPDSYDGSEPYGLVAWIHSNSGGSIPNDYKPVMDEKKLIWVGGDNIGNDQGTSRRIGKQILSVARMKELFNIDTNRIYSMGNSGGARTAHVSAMMHPFTFEGTLARCGAAYIGQVTQAYETRDPDSHYEYWGSSYYKAPAGMTYKEYLKGFGQRYAMLTSYGDFREGDMMNIYHFGFEADGFDSRLVETSGNHCTSTESHFRKGVDFVEHPLLELLDEEFAFQNGKSDFGESTLKIGDGNLFKESVYWNESYGLIGDFVFEPHSEGDVLEGRTELVFSAGTPFENIISWGNIGSESINLALEARDSKLYFELKLKSMSIEESLLVYSGFFEDYVGWTQDLKMKLFLLDDELQLHFNHHFKKGSDDPYSVELDDKRSLHLLWSNLDTLPEFLGGWSEDEWNDSTQSYMAIRYASNSDGDSLGAIHLKKTKIKAGKKSAQKFELDLPTNYSTSFSGSFNTSEGYELFSGSVLNVESSSKEYSLNVFDLRGRFLGALVVSPGVSVVDLSHFGQGLKIIVVPQRNQ